MRLLRPTLPVLCMALLLQSDELVAGWREAFPEARSVGEGEFRFFGFAIYGAQLWSPSSMHVDPLSFEQPFALELTYSRAISRDDLVAASLKELRRLAPSDPDAAVADWEREMRLAFVDVRAGDRITGVFLPGEGAHFYVGATLQHVVRDEAFAREFFAIWLDPRTRNPELRAQLLGAAGP